MSSLCAVCVLLDWECGSVTNFLSSENQNCRAGWKDYQATDCEWTELCKHNSVRTHQCIILSALSILAFHSPPSLPTCSGIQQVRRDSGPLCPATTVAQMGSLSCTMSQNRLVCSEHSKVSVRECVPHRSVLPT